MPSQIESQIESMIREWLDEPDITLVCGDWRSGSIMEIIPEGRAVLTRERYPEPFAGLRDLLLVGQGHHLHLDLGKLSVAVYSVVPSVCYGYRPSFEVRFGARADDAEAYSFAVGLRNPYRAGRPDAPRVVSYFRRMLDHRRRYPAVTRFRAAEAPPGDAEMERAWRDALACLAAARGVAAEEPQHA